MNTSNQEIEVKFLLRDYAALMQKISDLHLPCRQERIHEFNLRYDLPDGSLVAQKQVLRLQRHPGSPYFQGSWRNKRGCPST